MPAWSRNFTARRTGEDAQRLMAYTYFGLRYGMAALAFVFPIALWGLGAAFHPDVAMPSSISGYYHTDLRNYVVATLVLIGALLFLYKGFNRWENVLLNVAGATTVLIAFFPTGRGDSSTDAPDTFVAPQVHGTLAVITFVAMGVVAIPLLAVVLSYATPSPMPWRARWRPRDQPVPRGPASAAADV